MKAPTLILAGVHKSATTSLHEHLSGDPRIYMSNPKEPHFLIRDEVRDRLPFGVWDEAAYSDLWRGAQPGQVTGESSVLYSAFADAFVTSISGFDMLPYVVVMLRHPADRAFSSFHDERLKSATENAATFGDAIQRELERGPWRLDGVESPTMRHLALGRYAPTLRRLKATLGERLLVMLMSDYTNDPDGGVATVQHHVGLLPRKVMAPSVPRNQGGRSWRGGVVDSVMHNPTTIQARRRLKTAAPRLHSRLRDEAFARLTIRAERMSSIMRAQLIDLYRADIEETADLIQRDLSTWTRYPQQ